MNTQSTEQQTNAQQTLLAAWQAAWPQALAAWSRFTRLHEPLLCVSRLAASQEGLSGSFAMIRLSDQSVVVDLESIQQLGLQDYALEILAHEVGHHVFAPGSVTEQFRLLARIRRALPTLEKFAPTVANLYTDLYINDRLHRYASLRMADIYLRLVQHGKGQCENAATSSQIWTLYMRIYEQLWKLEKGSLIASNAVSPDMDTDAWLGARLIRVYAGDWMHGAGKFATLLLPYLMADNEASVSQQALAHLHDTKDAAAGCEPIGAQEIEADEINGAIHPANDPLVSGVDEVMTSSDENTASSPSGQTREPYEYGEILRAAGIQMSDHEIAIRYYRERTLPHLVPFPKRPRPESPEPQMEGLEQWDIGEPFDEIDWLQTLLQSPRPIPGLTTVKRAYGNEQGKDPGHIPVDLDMYVDSSGSMPNPQTHISYLTLAGAIIAMSALRAGSRVQVTLWSGKNQTLQTNGFVRDDAEILSVLTGFFGGATCFPIPQMRDTFASRKPEDRAVHILMISDDGITSMFDKDERGNDGWDISAMALEKGRAGGSMALNLPSDWEKESRYYTQVPQYLKRARDEQGWHIHAITGFEHLMEFARLFSQQHYLR